VAPDRTETVVTYDGDDPATVTLPSGNVLRFTYGLDAVNPADPGSPPVALLSDSLGTVRATTFDSQGRPVSETNGAGETSSRSYDADRFIDRVTGPDGLETFLYEYGEHGFATRLERNGEVVDSRTYDAVGNLEIGNDITDPYATSSGAVRDRRFDAGRNLVQLTIWGSVTSTGVPGNEDTTIEVRSDGQITAVRRPFGGDTEFVYDDLGRVVERRDLVDGVWQASHFEYDLASRVVASERPNGMRTELTYDAAGRVTQVTHLRNGVEESHFTRTWADGHVIAIADSEHSGPTLYSYDAAGRIDRVEFPEGESIILAHDVRSRATDVVYMRPDGTVLRALSFGYDAASREVAITDETEGLTVVDRVYDEGRIQSIAYGNGLERTFAYDSSHGYLAEIEMHDASGSPLEHTTITYQGFFSSDYVESLVEVEWFDSLGLVSNPPPGSHDGWVYSGSAYFLARDYHQEGSGHRISSWCKPYVNCAQGSIFQFDTQASLAQGVDYGAQGEVLMQCYDYNTERNRLLSVRQPDPQDTCQSATASEELRAYAYDAAGFATSIDGTPITWTAHGRVASVGSDIDFSWDAQGRLLESDVLGVRKHYRWGGLIQTDELGTPSVLELGEVQIDLLAGENLYRHFDFRMNVSLVSDQDGHIVTSNSYAAYGPEDVHGLQNDGVSFAGGRAVGDLLRLGARLYDPLARRFLSPDPVFQLVNEFAYTMGNPIWFGDPGGRSELGWQLFIMGTTVAGSYIVGLGLPYVGHALGAVVGFAVGTMIFQAFNPGDRGWTPADMLEHFNPLPSPPRRSRPSGESSGGGSGPEASANGGSGTGVAGMDTDTVGTDWGRWPRWFHRHVFGESAAGGWSQGNPAGGGPSCAGTGGGSGGPGGPSGCGLGTELALVMMALRCAWFRRRIRAERGR